MTDPAPRTADGFSAILARQCRTAPADSAALVRIVGAERLELLAIYPGLEGAGLTPSWVIEAARRLPRDAGDRRSCYVGAERAGGEAFAMVPVGAANAGTGADGAGPDVRVWAVYRMERGPADPGLVVERLAMSAAGLHILDAEGQLSSQAAENDLLRRTISSLSALAAHDRFLPTAMALCNHAASEWKCERVSLGVARGPYVRLAAMSHTEKFSARSALVQEIEGVMEECFDQDVEIAAPSESRSSVLNRAAREFALRHGPMSVLSVPLRRDGEPIGVLTLERGPGAPFSEADAAALRLLADACAAQIWLTHRYRRSLGAWAVSALRGAAGGMLGPRYAAAKLTGLALAAAAVFFTLVPGTYRVRADARIEAAERRVVAGPFDGFLVVAHSKAGDVVKEGDLLAALDSTDLLLRLGSLRAEHDGAVREAALAQREGKDAEALIARARARRAEADMRFVERQVEQASIKAPSSGTIVAGDLERLVGSPVRTGDRLFEIAALESLFVEVFVSEDQIADVSVGAVGALAPLSSPDTKLQVRITRVDPVAQLREGRNVFRVVCELEGGPAWLRPGMEGTVRFDAGRASYPWIWSRPALNWVRMKLWL